MVFKNQTAGRDYMVRTYKCLELNKDNNAISSAAKTILKLYITNLFK